ncbi:MAG: DUF167 domain-containing protein [Coriobacteriales bacterium]|jgi:uncharacterized protein (TIGR00251 family)|nr:DUF167 domain-containing protein [Coriobacteriales bacterium]
MSDAVPLTLAVRVVPRSGADAVVGWRGAGRDELGVRVTSAPEGGKANAAVIRTLARSLGIPKSAISVVRGHRSRQKLLALTMEEQRFEAWCRSLPSQPSP